MSLNPMFSEFVNMMKKNVETGFQSAGLVQEQTERMAKWMLEQTDSAQSESRKFMEQWLSNIKQQQQQYQSNLHGQLEKLEQFFTKKQS